MSEEKKDTKFQKGNKLWQLRKFDGRKPIFETPDQLWERACEYFDFIDNNPILKTDFKGKDNEMVQYDLQRPYTWHGLYVYLNVCNLDHYKTKTDFSDVLTRIGNIMYCQKFEGASSGIFNHAIIARDLGLTEKFDHTSKGEQINLPDYMRKDVK